MSKFHKLVARLDERVLRLLPGTLAMNLRLAVLRLAGASVGNGVVLGTGVRVLNPLGLVIEDGVSVARDCVLDARGTLILSSGCLIGFESVLLTSTHNSNDVLSPIQGQGMYFASVRVGANAWLGTRCILMPGVNIGDAVIVGSSSVVTKDLDSDQVYAGVPAKWIKNR